MNLEDPLQRYSGLSLLHRSLGSLSKPPCDPDPHHDDDLLSAHNFLKSLPVKNSDKLIEQAKSILDATSGLVNADLPNDAMPEDKIEVVVQKAAESPRARRPGLGRKRARFSLIHNSSQPSVILEPTLDMDNLKDPEQFFLAFERLEDAKKEMAKQTGRVSIGSHQSSMAMAPRPRRPGMPGRSRTVKYQHLYPTMSFQETSIEDILSPSNPGSQQETVSQAVALQLMASTNVALEESELAASMAKAEKRVDKLLDELLACDCEELDGDRAVTLLQDRLQVKSLDIEKLNLPELLYVQRTNLNALGGNLPKPRNVLSHIHNLLTRTLTPMKQQIAGNSTSSFGSPTPPKSQLASLALLRKHILQSNPPTNPVLKSLIIEEDDTTAGNSSPTEVAVKALNDNLTSLGSGSDVRPGKSSAEVENSNVGVDNGITYEYLSQLGGDADIQTNGPNELEDMVEDIQQKAVDKSLNGNLSSLGSGSIVCPSNTGNLSCLGSGSIVCPSNTGNLSCLGSGSIVCPSKTSAEVENSNIGVDDGVIDENSSLCGGDVDIQTNRRNELEDMPEDTAMEYLNPRDQFEQLSAAFVEDHAMDSCPKTQDRDLEQTKANTPKHNNERVEKPPVVSTNKQTKEKSCTAKRCKYRSLSRRQSLAASGTSWETGVRRSTRIRSRPLEYWKGERFLYGRIHGSLATVIGIKYESPQNDKGKPALKVKSFVSDEYKNLVELAALH